MNLYTYIYLNNEERFAASIWGVSIASVFEKSSNALPTFLPYNSEECDPPYHFIVYFVVSVYLNYVSEKFLPILRCRQ